MIPVGFAGGAEVERQGAIILREIDVGLALELAVHINLREIGAAHARHVIPNAGSHQGARVQLGHLGRRRSDRELENVTAGNPDLAQIEAFKVARSGCFA